MGSDAMKKSQTESDQHEKLANDAATSGGGAAPVPCGGQSAVVKAQGEMENEAKKTTEKFTKTAEAHLKKQRVSQKACDEMRGKEESKKKSSAEAKAKAEEKHKKAAEKKKEEGK